MVHHPALNCLLLFGGYGFGVNSLGTFYSYITVTNLENRLLE